MADPESLDSQIYPFKAFHRTFVSYPHRIAPLNPHFAHHLRLSMLPVHNAHNRYEPGTLVSDHDVRTNWHTDRLNEDEMKLYSTNAAIETFDRNALTQHANEPFPGQTTLRVATVQTRVPLRWDTVAEAQARLRDQLLNTERGIQHHIEQQQLRRQKLAAQSAHIRQQVDDLNQTDESEELERQIDDRTLEHLQQQLQQGLRQTQQHIQLVEQQIEELVRLSRLPRAPQPRPGHRWVVRIRRESNIRRTGGEVHTDAQTYEISLSHFRQRVAATEAAWAQLVLEAIYRSTDLAFLHAQENIEEYGIRDDNPPVWKRPREDTVDAAVNSVVTPANVQNLRDEDRLCTICGEVLGSEDPSDPVVLPCGRAHIFCRTCAIAWAQNQFDRRNGPDAANVSCALCRGTVLDQADVDGIPFGLLNGVYFNDPRFTAAENAKRSCADLWVNLAENSREWFFVNPDLLWQICNILVELDKLEDEISTPRHLQHVHSLIFQQALRHIEGLLALSSGQYRRTDEFLKHLSNGARMAIYHNMVRAGVEHYLSFGPIGPEGHLDSDFSATLIDEFERPGWFPYVVRLLNCMLEFQRLRKCDCGAPGFHKHGDRNYFNEELLTRPSTELVRLPNIADTHNLQSARYWEERMRPADDNQPLDAGSQATSTDTGSDMTEESGDNFRPRRGSETDPDTSMRNLYPDIFEGTGNHAVAFEEDDEWRRMRRFTSIRRPLLELLGLMTATS